MIKIRQTVSNHPTVEKAYILGVLCGDGHISKCKKSTYEIGMRTTDKEFALNFKSKFQKVDGLFLHIEILPPLLGKIRGKIHNCKKQFRVRACSKIIYYDLLKYDPKGKFKGKTWRAPREVMNSKEEEIICSFLRGFLDSEGTINKYSLEVASSNKKGLDDVKELLSRIGIKRFHFYKDWKDVWKLIFCGKDNLIIFFEKVEFSIHRKQRKLRRSIKFKKNVLKDDYWAVLTLKMLGYGYRRISKLTNLNVDKIRSWSGRGNIPDVIQTQIRLERYPENWENLCKRFPFLMRRF